MRIAYIGAFIAAASLSLGCGSSSSGGSGGSAGTSTGNTTEPGTGGTGGTAGTGGTTGTGGNQGPGADCRSCNAGNKGFHAPGACTDALNTCKADTDCSAWLGCVDACFGGNYSNDCLSTCDLGASVAMSYFQPLIDCACDTCGAECEGVCPF